MSLSSILLSGPGDLPNVLPGYSKYFDSVYAGVYEANSTRFGLSVKILEGMEAEIKLHGEYITTEGAALFEWICFILQE